MTESDIMPDEQYSIGGFAAVNKITPRMLRHYDKIGLLKPAAVLENGYRAYTSDQIETISGIRLYQSCGFTLTEIMQLMNADETELRQAAKAKLAEVDRHDKLQQLARRQLLCLSGDFPQPFTNHYDISYVRQSEQTLFCCVKPVAEIEIEAAIESLYDAIHIQNAEPNGSCLLLSDLKTVDAYRVAVPVKAPLIFEGY